MYVSRATQLRYVALAQYSRRERHNTAIYCCVFYYKKCLSTNAGVASLSLTKLKSPGIVRFNALAATANSNAFL